MRLDDVSPRTWVLGAGAGWALLVWVLALAGMGGRVPPLADDPSLLHTLPRPTAPPPERLGPFGQYDEIAARPLFSEDRRPQPFSLGGDDAEQGSDFDYILTSVLLAPQVKLAMLQPDGGGEPLRVKLGDGIEAAPAWRLVALNPRSAVFEGPGGRKTLELRVFDGKGGEPPTPVAEAAPAPNPAGPARVPVQRPTIVPPPRPEAVAGGKGASKPTAPEPGKNNVQQQMDDLRRRIEQRRAQLRADEIRETGGTPPPPDKP